MKNKKLYHVIVREIHESDYNGRQVIRKLDFYRYSTSKRQLISNLRHTQNFYDHDIFNGSTSITYTFEIEEIEQK